MTKRINVIGGVGAVVAALGVAAGCGDSFGSGDCHASRTCESTGGETTAGGAKNSEGGADTTPGGDGPVAGGAGSSAGAAGAASECDVAADCSNGDPEDGEETCDAGACGAGNPPPTIVSFTPQSDAAGVEPDVQVVIEFNEPIDPKTITPTSVQLLDGTTAVPGTLVYADSKVTFTPSSPLALVAPYTISVSTDVTDEDGAALLSKASSTFSIRDGVWTTITVAKDQARHVQADDLSMASDGRVLIAWQEDEGLGESFPFAGWFLRGKAIAPARALADADQGGGRVWAATNASGVGLVGWGANAHLQTRQYRGDAWQTAPSWFGDAYLLLGLAMMPSGRATAIAHDYQNSRSGGWTSDETGIWPATGVPISTITATGDTSIAIDSAGNGLAAWRADDPSGTHRERIVTSTLSGATGKWALSTDLLGSLATSDDSHERGEPVVAVDQQGGGMALWVNIKTKQLMANRYSLSSWEAPEAISGTLVIDLQEIIDFAPALVFDGQAFVAAWTASDGGVRYAYTARYDLTTGWGKYERQQQAASDGTSAPIMPSLASDGRGNLMLVFAKGAAGASYSRVYQRYVNQTWSEIQSVPDSTINYEDGFNLLTRPLAMSPNGLATLAWNHYDDVKSRYDVVLSSFY